MKKENIDFSGVETEIRRREGNRRVKPGDYEFKITKVEKRYKDDDKSNPPYFSWRLTGTKGAVKGASYFFVTTLRTEALFNLRNIINAATGKNVAGRAVKFDPETLIGKIIGGAVDDEEYDGKIRSRVVHVMPVKEIQESDDDEDDDDDEEEED